MKPPASIPVRGSSLIARVEIGKAQRILVEEDRRIVDSNCLCCDVSIQRKIRRAEISDMSIGAGFS